MEDRLVKARLEFEVEGTQEERDEVLGLLKESPWPKPAKASVEVRPVDREGGLKGGEALAVAAQIATIVVAVPVAVTSFEKLYAFFGDLLRKLKDRQSQSGGCASRYGERTGHNRRLLVRLRILGKWVRIEKTRDEDAGYIFSISCAPSEQHEDEGLRSLADYVDEIRLSNAQLSMQAI